ncbi:MAG TPA: hypothetical protein VLA98_10415 [Solirubrobacteraceae bacterium]|nr:hypothetical protein [Solirubrobacteraceae bacterium]
MVEVEVRNVAGEPAAIGNAGPYTVVVDRPAGGGGRGVGFNGGELLYLAVAGCLSGGLPPAPRRARAVEAESREAVRAVLASDPWSGTHLRIDAIERWTIRLDGR